MRHCLVAFLVALSLGSCCPLYEPWDPSENLARATHPEVVTDPTLGSLVDAMAETARLQWKPAGLSNYAAYESLKIKAVPSISAQEGEFDAQTASENRFRLELMYGDEHERIWRAKSDNFQHRVGLALSGGGIRAASFASGVLQALHEEELLKEVGYLSTVSGGGFAGAWYMVHADSDALLRPGSDHLKHLSQYGHYLTVGNAAASWKEGAWNLVKHIGTWPVAALLNEIPFHWQQNVYGIRNEYRKGIERAFLYKSPLSPGGELACEKSDTLATFGPTQDKPFWVVNVHQSLSDSDNPITKNRSGDAFEITPLRAGSGSVSYVKTPGRTNRDTWWMKPAYAVAISGAALDSTSWEQGYFASLASYLANADLGYFVPSWGEAWRGGLPSVVPNALYLAKSVFPLSLLRHVWESGFRDHNLTVDGKRFALTDGGHFDNLGAYALVRRGCRTIIICDAGTDPSVNAWGRNPDSTSRARAFEDLRRLETKIFTDFGAVLEMEWESFDPRSQPTRRGFTNHVPAVVMVGRIRNLPVELLTGASPPKDPDALRDVGIVYIKAAYDFERAMRTSATFIDRQKSEHDQEFPNRVITDQFFSERQVNAYRRYAYEIVKQHAWHVRRAIDRVR